MNIFTANEIITLVISIISLIIAFHYSSSSARQHKFKLKILQLYDGAQSGVLLSFDGCSAPVEEMTGQPAYSQVSLIRISLINESASPISITSFLLNDEEGPIFADYSDTIPFFQISLDQNSKVNFGYPDKHLEYLKPIISLSPYESISGYLLFPLSDVYQFDYSKDVNLLVKTSRGNISERLKFGSVYNCIDSAKYSKPTSINYYAK